MSQAGTSATGAAASMRLACASRDLAEAAGPGGLDLCRFCVRRAVLVLHWGGGAKFLTTCAAHRELGQLQVDCWTGDVGRGP